MTRKKKSKRASRKHSANQKLASLFKMSREQLQTRKVTGGGAHRPKTPDTLPRGEQKRRSIDDQLQ